MGLNKNPICVFSLESECQPLGKSLRVTTCTMSQIYKPLPNSVIVNPLSSHILNTSRFPLAWFALSRFPLAWFAFSWFALARFALGRFALARFVLPKFALAGFALAMFALATSVATSVATTRPLRHITPPTPGHAPNAKSRPICHLCPLR